MNIARHPNTILSKINKLSNKLKARQIPYYLNII